MVNLVQEQKGRRWSHFSLAQIEGASKLIVLRDRGREVQSLGKLKKEWKRLKDEIKGEMGWLEVRDEIEDARDLIVESERERRRLCEAYPILLRKLNSKKEDKMKKEIKKAKIEEKDETPSIDELLRQEEPQVEKTKTVAKAEKKENKAKVNGQVIAQKDMGPCAICGKEIRKGHFVGRLIADEHNAARLYHEKTCGAGTEAWRKFKANGKETPKNVVEEEEKTVKKGAIEKKTKKQQGRGKGGNGVNKFGHRVGSMSALVDDLLTKGTSVKDADAKGIKAKKFLAHVKHYAKHDEHKSIRVTEKNGVYKIAT